jgi:putative pyruvate formate lyase activating enzyme
MSIPAYLKLPPGELLRRGEAAGAILKNCTLCPHNCMVDRTAGDKGFCRTGSAAIVSSWGPHHGEERPLVARFGSGTIFFTGCNLGCIFCQNWTISHGNEGREMTHDRLASVMLELKKSGCHNINLVTPTHQVPAILRALSMAAAKGLDLPLVYNCGGYESIDTLRLLDGIVDIYMPDIKYMDTGTAFRYSGAKDYPEVVRAALHEMHRQTGDMVIDENGAATRGLLVRHLVLPGELAGTDEVMSFLSREISAETYVNIMDQYHPCFHAHENPPLGRRITRDEYRAAVGSARRAGLKRLD